MHGHGRRAQCAFFATQDEVVVVATPIDQLLIRVVDAFADPAGHGEVKRRVLHRLVAAQGNGRFTDRGKRVGVYL